MLRIAIVIFCIMVLYLIMCASPCLTMMAMAFASESGSAADAPVESIAIIKKCCPSLAELPLMLGRPAPCIKNYSLFGH
nr:hypothetical protein [candidate division Zixibacteria bacterium]